MVELATLQVVSYIMSSLGVCIAVFYNMMTLRVQQANMKNTLETRQAQIFRDFRARRLLYSNF